MKKVNFEGREYQINKHNVVLYDSGPDVFPGCGIIRFPDMETERKIVEMVKNG